MALIHFFLALMALFGLPLLASAAYSESGHNVVAYWGQTDGQKSLGAYCQAGNVDIIIVSFIDNFKGSSVSYNFGDQCSDKTCPDIAKDIATCQNLGIKVLLSMGGGSGSYSVASSSDAEATAEKMYELFGPKGTVFPGAQFDGIDLDIEHGKYTGYPALVSAIKKKFPQGFLVTSAPQCPYPDKYVGDAIKSADIDMAFIQFYNNDCSVDQKTFNWDTWSKNVQSFSNKNMKLYIGLLGTKTKEDTGYVTPDVVKSKASSALSDSNFGGFMVWDVTLATNNKIDGKPFIKSIRSIAGAASSNKPTKSGSATASNSYSSSTDSSGSSYSDSDGGDSSSYSGAATFSKSSKHSKSTAETSSTSSLPDYNNKYTVSDDDSDDDSSSPDSSGSGNTITKTKTALAVTKTKTVHPGSQATSYSDSDSDSDPSYASSHSSSSKHHSHMHSHHHSHASIASSDKYITTLAPSGGGYTSGSARASSTVSY